MNSSLLVIPCLKKKTGKLDNIHVAGGVELNIFN